MKYKAELREGNRWVAADREAGVELAPWFHCQTTCTEIGLRTEKDGVEGQYMNGIPVVPIDSPIPRPPEVKAMHPAAVRKALKEGRNPLSLWNRHPLNPSR